MRGTKIRWANHSWNWATGCTEVSEGCDNCYARKMAERWGPNSKAFPVGFEPMLRPNRLREPARIKEPSRIFVNSMSDVFHRAFTQADIDAAFDVMLEITRHAYMILTKRPDRMEHYIRGWLDRQHLEEVPAHIWLGTSVESSRYLSRVDTLRRIPVPIRFLSCEPLIAPLLNVCATCNHHIGQHGLAGCRECETAEIVFDEPRHPFAPTPGLNLDGISWVIVGGESGNGSSKFRPMPHTWARDIQELCELQDVAFFFKQSAGYTTETGVELGGRRYEEYPADPPGEEAPVLRGQGAML